MTSSSPFMHPSTRLLSCLSHLSQNKEGNMEDRRSSHGVSDEQIDPSLANVGLTNQPNRPSDDEMVGALEGADDGNLWGSEDEDEEGGFQQVAEVHGQTDSSEPLRYSVIWDGMVSELTASGF